MIFCAGVLVAETRPEQLDADGYITWEEPLQLPVRGVTERLVATVISSRSSDSGPWCVVPGCRFKIPAMKAGSPHRYRTLAAPSAWSNDRPGLEIEIVEGDTTGKLLGTILEDGYGFDAGDNPRTLITGESFRGTGENLETFFEGDSSKGVRGHLEALVERDFSPGDAGDLEELSEGAKSQRVGRHLEPLTEHHTNLGRAGLPPSSTQETLAGLSSCRSPASAAKKGERLAASVLEQDSDAGSAANGSAEGNGGVALDKAWTTLLALGRGLLPKRFASPSPPSSSRPSASISKGGRCLARGDGVSKTIFSPALNSAIDHDHSLPMPASPSVFPSKAMPLGPAQAEVGGGKMVQRTGVPTRSLVRCKHATSNNSISTSSTFHPTVPYRKGIRLLKTFAKWKSFHSVTSSGISYDSAQDSWITLAWKELAACTAWGEKALANARGSRIRAVDTPPLWASTQSDRLGSSLFRAPGRAPGAEGNTRHAAPRRQQDDPPLKAGTRPGGTLHAVGSSTTKLWSITPSTSTATPTIAPTATISSTRSGAVPSTGPAVKPPRAGGLMSRWSVRSSTFTRRVFVLKASSAPPRCFSAASSDAPHQSYDANIVWALPGACQLAAISARIRARRKGKILELANQFFSYEYDDFLLPNANAYATELVSAKTSTVSGAVTTSITGYVQSVDDAAFGTEGLMPRGGESSVEGTHRAHDSTLPTVVVAQTSSPGAVEGPSRQDSAFLSTVDQRGVWYDCSDDLQPSLEDFATRLVSADTSIKLQYETTPSTVHALTIFPEPFDRKQISPRGETLSVGARRAHSSPSDMAPVVQSPSPEAVEVASPPDTQVPSTEDQRGVRYGHSDDHRLSSEEYATNIVSAETSTMLGNDTTSTSTYALDVSEVSFNTDRPAPRGGASLAMGQREHGSGSPTAAVSRNPFPEDQRVPFYGRSDYRQPGSERYATELVSTEASTVHGHVTTSSYYHASANSDVPFSTGRLMPRSEGLLVGTQRANGSDSSLTAAARNTSPEAVQTAARSETRPASTRAIDSVSCPHTRTAPSLPPVRNTEGGELVYFTCSSSRSVCVGRGFQLRVSACAKHVCDDPARAVLREGAIAACVSGARRIAPGERVTVTLVRGGKGGVIWPKTNALVLTLYIGGITCTVSNTCVALVNIII